MRRFRTDGAWRQLKAGFQVDSDKARFQIRTDGELNVYEVRGKAETLVGCAALGDAEIEVTGKGPHKFQISATEDAKAWIRFPATDQMNYRTTDEKFTSLDRPAPLSPEMQAIERMMRRNEIERENMRREMEHRHAKLQQRLERETSGDVLESMPSETEGDLEPATERLPASTEVQESGESDPLPASDERKPQAKPAGKAGAKNNGRSAKKGNTADS